MTNPELVVEREQRGEESELLCLAVNEAAAVWLHAAGKIEEVRLLSELDVGVGVELALGLSALEEHKVVWERFRDVFSVLGKHVQRLEVWKDKRINLLSARKAIYSHSD